MVASFDIEDNVPPNVYIYTQIDMLEGQTPHSIRYQTAIHGHGNREELISGLNAHIELLRKELEQLERRKINKTYVGPPEQF